jgi:HEAT repeat protein/transglutaminase-like putative cysteine protease
MPVSALFHSRNSDCEKNLADNNWLCRGITIIAIIIAFFLMNSSVEASSAPTPSPSVSPSSSQKKAPLKSCSADSWMNVFLRGTKIGTAHMTTIAGPSEFEGRKTTMYENRSEIKIKRGGKEVVVTECETVHSDAETGAPVANIRRSSTARGEQILLEQRFEGDQVHQTMKIVDSEDKPVGREQRSTFTRKNHPNSSHQAMKELRDAGYKIGDKREFTDFSITRGKDCSGTLQVKASRLIESMGKSVEVVVLEEAEKDDAGAHTTEYWIIPSTGSYVQISYREMGLRMELTTKENACAAERIEDSFTAYRAPVKPPIPHAEELTELHLLVKTSGKGPKVIIACDDRQKVEQEPGGALLLKLCRTETPPLSGARLPLSVPADLHPCLEPSILIQSDDETIIRTAHDIVGDERKALIAVEKLCLWVKNNMRYSLNEAVYGSAKETLRSRTGDCTEYSLLFAALARATGIPARVCVGLCYDGCGAFGWHQWNEVHIDGKWLPVDSVAGSVGIGCEYIKLTDLNCKDYQEIRDRMMNIMAPFELEPVACRLGTKWLDIGEEAARKSRFAGNAYIDGQRGLLVRAPKDRWKLHPPGERGELFLLTLDRNEASSNEQDDDSDTVKPHVIAMIPEGVKEGVTLDDYAEALCRNMPGLVKSFTLIRREPGAVAGRKAIIADCRADFGEGMLDVRFVIFRHGKEMLNLVFYLPEGTIEKGYPDYEQIIKGIRFFDEPGMLKQLSEQDPTQRRIAVVALGLLGSKNAVDPLLKMLTAELRDMQSPVQGKEKKVPVKDIVEALGSVGDLRSLEIFEAMAGSADPAVREAAATGIAGLKSSEAAGLLVILAGDSESKVESAALRQCGKADPELMAEAMSKLVTSASQESRHRAALIAGSLKSVKALGILRRLLRDSSPEVREVASRALIGKTDETGTDCLIAALMDPVPEVRANAAKALAGKKGVKKDRKERDALFNALSDPDSETACTAADSLAAQGIADSMESAAKLMARADRLCRVHALEILGHLETPLAEPSLIQALKDSEASVRIAAVNALGKYDGAPVIEALERVLSADKDREVLKAAAQVMKHKNYRQAAVILKGRVGKEDAEGRASLTGALVEMLNSGGDDILSTLAQDASPQVRLSLTRSLYELKNPNDVVWKSLMSLARDREPGIQSEALRDIKHFGIGQRAEVAHLLKSLDTGCSKEITRLKNQCLATWQQPEAIPVLLELLAEGGEEEYEEAADYLSSIENEQVVPEFVDRVKKASLQELRGLCCYARMMNLTVEALGRWLSDDNPRIRAVALDYLGFMAYDLREKNVPRSETCLKLFMAGIKSALSDKDETARAMAVYAWGTMQGDAGLPELQNALKDESPEVRRAAWICLASCVESNGGKMCQWAMTEKHPDVREAAEQALAKWDAVLQERAFSLAASGDCRGACEILKEALQAAPGDLHIRCALARINARLGNTSEADSLMSEYLKLQKVISPPSPGFRSEWSVAQTKSLYKPRQQSICNTLTASGSLFAITDDYVAAYDSKSGAWKRSRRYPAFFQPDTWLVCSCAGPDGVLCLRTGDEAESLWQCHMNEKGWQCVLSGGDSINELSGTWMTWIRPYKDGILAGSDTVSLYSPEKRGWRIFEETRNRVGDSAPLLKGDNLWLYNQETGLSRLNLETGRVASQCEAGQNQPETRCFLAEAGGVPCALFTKAEESLSDDDLLFSKISQKEAVPDASAPTSKLMCYDEKGDCWKEEGRVMLPEGATISSLAGDKKSRTLWAVIQPYNLIVSIDLDNRVCRTILPCLPIHEKENANKIRKIAVSGNKVYIVCGNELFEMGR